MKNRVRIGTCSGPAEASFVRSVFDAHDLPVVINGEMHAYTMGGLGGFVRLDILVDAEDAEDAIALLRDIRAGDHAVSEGDDPGDGTGAPGDEPSEAREGDERADAVGVWDAKSTTAPPAPPPTAPAYTPTKGFDLRRRRTGIVLLLSVMAGFGTAHMSTGAWGRGFAIAALNVLGIAWAVGEHPNLGGWILFGARFLDMFGALWRVWSQPAGAARSG